VTATTINVGALVTVLDFGANISNAAQARFNQANQAHELPCGRQIKIVDTQDDNNAPGTNLAAIRKLVQLDHVFAIVPTLSADIESGAVYINQQDVPTIGWGVTQSYCATKNLSDMYLFGFNGCLTEPAPYTYETAINGPLLAKLYQLQGKNPVGASLALLGDDSNQSIEGNVALSTQDGAAGFNVVSDKNIVPAPPTVVTDWSPYVQALLTSDHGHAPDVIDIGALGPADAFPLSAALQQAGYKGIIHHSTYAPQLAAAAKGDQVGNTFATTESTAPAMASIVSALHAGGVTQIGQPQLSAYFSADMFVQILKKVGPDLTPQRFQQTAANFTYQIPGVIGPTYYPQGFIAGAPCGEVLYSNGTTWTVSVPYQCFGVEYKKVNGKYTPVPYPSGVTSP
jgi:ABC-type branched-subunit amino acid transport system substrate-binding protein